MRARFGRVITAMVTPFTTDGSLHLDEAQRLARHLVDTGSEGIVVTGSTGESPTLTDEEKTSLFRAVKDAVGSDVSVVAGTGTYDTHHSIDLSRAAEKAGADALLVVTPYYSKPPQDALLEHFRAVADSTDLPVMLYDVPGRTALKASVDTLLRAAEHPRIVAVKEASGDLSSIAAVATGAPDGFEIYCGQDEWTLPMLAWGAVGVVSVVAHVAGRRYQELFDAWDRGDVQEARTAQASMLGLVEAAFCTSNPIPIKAALEMLGFTVGAPRPPLRAASEDERAKVRKALEDFGAL